MKTNMDVYAVAPEIAAPMIPNLGTSTRLSAMSRAAETDRDHGVAAESGDGEGKNRHDSRTGVELGASRQEAHEPRRQQAQDDREPAGDEEQIGEDVPVGPLRLVLILDRVRERRPSEPEGSEQEQRGRGDPDSDGVVADGRLSLELGDEEPIAERKRPERELRRDERQAKPVHRSEQPPVELQAELVAAVAEQHEVDAER